MGWRDTLRDVVDRVAGPRADVADTPRADGVFDIDGISATMPSGSHLTPSRIPWLSRDERRRAAATGIGRRVVRAPADLATAPGWETRSGERRSVTAKVDRDLNVRRVLTDAWSLARQDGLAWILIMDSTADDLTKPLPDGPVDVVGLRALSYNEVIPRSWESDPLSPDIGGMLTAWVTIDRPPAVAVSLGEVHRSRLVRVPGLWRDPTAQSPPGREGGDLSAIEAYWYAIADFDQTGQSIAEVARMMAIPWMQMPGMAAKISAEGRTALIDIVSRLRRAMGSHGLLTVPADSQVGVLSPSLAGIGDVEASQYRRLTAVEGAPADWLLDLRVGGIGSDPEGRMRLLQAYADGLRRAVGDPVLSALYDVLMGEDPDREIVWNPVSEPTASEAAKVELDRANAAAARVNAMITDARAEREHLTGENRWDLPPIEEASGVGGDEVSDDVAALWADLMGARADAEPTDDDRAQKFSIPEAVKNNAARALAWREEHDLSHGTSTGWARARQLADGGTVTGQDVIEMAAWFARHSGNAKVADEYADEPWRDAGYVMWLAWGGDTARSWVEGIRENMGV